MQRLRALVVDDDLSARRFIMRTLSDIGITDTTEACDGTQALKAVGEADFNVVLLDWNMPKMTGIEVLGAIRQAGCKTPVIMVTGQTDKACVVEAMQAGVSDYLVKPFSPSQLAEKVRRFLPVVD